LGCSAPFWPRPPVFFFCSICFANPPSIPTRAWPLIRLRPLRDCFRFPARAPPRNSPIFRPRLHPHLPLHPPSPHWLKRSRASRRRNRFGRPFASARAQNQTSMTSEISASLSSRIPDTAAGATITSGAAAPGLGFSSRSAVLLQSSSLLELWNKRYGPQLPLSKTFKQRNGT
jgi:hypothetical protein